MIEHIPLPFVFFDGAMVVPGGGIAVHVVYDYAASGVGPQRMICHGIGHTGCLAPGDVCINNVVFSISLPHGGAFVETVFLFGEDTGTDAARFQGTHIVTQSGTPQGKLAPEVIGLSVIVNEYGRVDAVAVGTEDGSGVCEGAFGSVGYGHRFKTVGTADVQIIFAVPVYGIRGIQSDTGFPWDAGGVHGVPEGYAVIRPPGQGRVVCGEDMVFVGTIVLAARNVEGAVQIQPSVRHGTGFHIGDKILFR